MADVSRINAVLAAFRIDEPTVRVERLAGGHIHTTVRVVTAHRDVVVQSVNEHVFRDLDACESNLARIDAHFRHADAPIAVPRHHLAADGRVHWRDASGTAWRMTDHAAGTSAASTAADANEAHDAAQAFGRYVAWLARLPGAPLRETIPLFHDLASRANAFEAAVHADRVGRLRSCADLVSQARALLADDRAAAPLDQLPAVSVHNDAKVPNLRVDAARRYCMVVDLDTTMPGSTLFDVGELLRTGVGDAPEDVEDLSAIDIDDERRRAIFDGFLDGAGSCVDPHTRLLLGTAGARMALENGIRFLADHLDGDRYFAVHHDDHNLIRARAQLHLAARFVSDPSLAP